MGFLSKLILNYFYNQSKMYFLTSLNFYKQNTYFIRFLCQHIKCVWHIFHTYLCLFFEDNLHYK